MGNCLFLNAGEGRGNKTELCIFLIGSQFSLFPLAYFEGWGKGSRASSHAFGEADDQFGHFSLLLLFKRGLLSLHWKMQIKLDLYVNMYIVQAFLLEAKFKTTHCPFGGVPSGPQIGWKWHVTFSAQRSFYSFSYGEIFHKIFFHQKPGVFSAISLLSS